MTGTEGLIEVTPEAFGARLRELREAAGVSQAALAEHLDVGQTAISFWEKGRNSPNFVQVVNIAEYLGVEISAFLVNPKRVERRKRGRPPKN
jgi:repressor LexA